MPLEPTGESEQEDAPFVVCLRCNEEVDATSNYCPDCGASLDRVENDILLAAGPTREADVESLIRRTTSAARELSAVLEDEEHLDFIDPPDLRTRADSELEARIQT